MSWISKIPVIGSLYDTGKNLFDSKSGLNKSLFGGHKERFSQQNLLNPEQQPILSESIQAAKGAPGTARNYYQDLLSDDSEDYNAFARPELRRFNEEIIPDLAHQFAGMGSGGGLDSSSFRNAAVNAGTDLSERLGAIRANLRQTGVQGLQNLTNTALGNFTETIHRPATKGVVPNAIEGFAHGAGEAVTGAVAGGVGGGGQIPQGQITRP